MDAAKLKHKLTIQRPIEAQNSVGEAVEVWVDYAPVWGSLEPLQGRELYQAQAMQAETVAKATIRYRPGITPKMRIVHRGLVYAITAPPQNKDTRDRQLVIMLGEGLRD